MVQPVPGAQLGQRTPGNFISSVSKMDVHLQQALQTPHSRLGSVVSGALDMPERLTNGRFSSVRQYPGIRGYCLAL
jgi:hypothetical protein